MSHPSAQPFPNPFRAQEKAAASRLVNTPAQNPNVVYAVEAPRNTPQQPFSNLQSHWDRWKQRLGLTGNGKYAFFNYLVILICVIAFCVELGVNNNLTGSVIQTGGNGEAFNIMIGPAAITWIRTGARFVPCMRSTPLDRQRLALSSAPGAPQYTIPELCGLSEFSTPGVPDQTFRFLSAVFLHGGLIHLLMNMIVQWRVGVPLEKEHGPIRIAAVYLVSGVTGFLLGAVISPLRLVSLGASGALFGLIACLLWEIAYRWHDIVNPKRELFILILLIVISFCLGFIPGVDNFSHLGGFAMGLLLGVAVLDTGSGPQDRFIDPTTGQTWSVPSTRKPFYTKWWWWIVRLVALVLAIVYFAVLYAAFNSGKSGAEVCSWCRYLSCLPVAGGCDVFDSDASLG